MAPPKQSGANLRDVQIAFCKVFGMTNAEAAEAISTPEHPTGVSERTVLNRLAENRPFIEELVRWAVNIKRDRQLEVKELTIDTLRSEMEKQIGQAWSQIVQAVKEGDTESAWRLIEHQIGKPNQVHKHEGDVNVNHRMTWQPQHLLQKMDRDLEESQKLLAALPSEITEGELVETS